MNTTSTSIEKKNNELENADIGEANASAEGRANKREGTRSTIALVYVI